MSGTSRLETIKCGANLVSDQKVGFSQNRVLVLPAGVLPVRCLIPGEILRPKSHVWCSHTTARASLGTSTAGVVPRGPGATAGVLRCPPGCTVVARATKNTPNRLVIAVFAGFLKRAARGGFPGLRRTGPRPPKRPPGTQPAPRCRALAQSSADSLQP